MEILGYIARHYADTNVHLGMKDGWVYVYGEMFGGLVNVGAVEYYQGLIADSGAPATVNLTGHWTGSGASIPFPGCTGTLAVDLVQNGNALTGAGTMVGVCLGPPEQGQITGTISGDQITFGVAFDDVSQIFYEGALSDDQVTLSGTYDWPDEDDYGTWSLHRE
jgi:hypothetical protein